MDPLQAAKKIREIYTKSCEFSEWVIDSTMWTNFNFNDTKVFYHKDELFDDVKKMVTFREPCNMTMCRYYDIDRLKKEFGWERGAYQLSTEDKLMPNIAVYCNATIKLHNEFINVHVINLVGFAFDCVEQPDYKYFMNKPINVLIHHYSKMWGLAYAAAAQLKKDGKITTIKVYNVGGGAFAGRYGNSFIEKIFEPSFLPLLPAFEKTGICVEGYNKKIKEFDGGFIPTVLVEPEEDVKNTLYVNAWDPWSLIGNGNDRDRSLDGYWGRCSNMSVLGWLKTNPNMRFIPV